MIVKSCDGCGEAIGKDAECFAVDHHERVHVDVTTYHDEEPVALLAEFSTEAEFHFCSGVCLSSWAMEQAVKS